MSNGSTGRYLAAFLIALLIGRRKKVQRAGSKHHTDKANHEGQRLNPVNVRIANEGWPSDHSRHQRNETKYWIASIVISIAAFIAACVAVYYANGAFQQARRQADAAVEANRPWLSIEQTATAREMQVEESEFFVGMKIAVKNLGHAVARNVKISSAIIPSVISIDPAHAAERYCRQAEADRFNSMSQSSEVVFPDAKTNLEFFATSKTKFFIERDIFEKKQFFDRIIKSLLLKDRKNDFRPTADTIETHQVDSLTVIGCATYQSVSEADSIPPHGTSFAFRVSKKAIGDGVGLIELKKPAFTDGKDLLVEPNFIGGYAD